MSVAARWDPGRQRRTLRLMGIDPPRFRAARAAAPPAAAVAIAPAPARSAAPAPAPDAVAGRLRVLGLSSIAAADPLFQRILRSLGTSALETAFGAGPASSGPDLPVLAFGPGHGEVPALPVLAALRADPRAKRTAWRDVLRPLARRMRKS